MSKRDLYNSSDYDRVQVVHFALDETTYVEPNLSRLDSRRMAAMYYTKEDYQTFRDEIDVIVASIDQGRGTSSCVRGLECRTKQGTRRKAGNRIRAKNAVLQEQSRQHNSKNTDPELLAEIYKGFCITSTTHALRTARADAAASQLTLEEIMLMDCMLKCKDKSWGKDDDTASTVSSTWSLSTP